MGSGSSTTPKATPTILRGFSRERTHQVIPFATEQYAGDGVSRETSQAESKPSSAGGTTSIDSQTGEEFDDGDEASTTEAGKGGTDNLAHLIETIDGKNSAPWPARTFVKLDFNVNGYHGGCAGIAMISCAFGGKGEETNAEAFIVNAGFDCNHFAVKSFYRDHAGHFGPENKFATDEKGTLVVDALFGSNHARLLTNDGRYGNLRNGVFIEGTGTETPLPLNVNGASNGENGAGLTFVLCSAVEGDTAFSALYLARSGYSDNHIRCTHKAGDDKFTFTQRDGILHATGPGTAKYSLFHNRDNLNPHNTFAYVSQTQNYSGKEALPICGKLDSHCAFLVLCSSSNGTENSTASSLYFVTVADSKVVASTEIAGLFAAPFTSSDLWKFDISNGSLLVVGPDSPCKYGIMSNLPATSSDILSSVKQTGCLATGESTKTKGTVSVSWENVTGEVNNASPIHIMWNHRNIKVLAESELRKENNSFTFSYAWSESEKAVGYHTIRVFAVRKHVQSGADVFIELSGSPHTMTKQKEGVTCAINCGGPAYQAINDIVYASEFSMFANFDPKLMKGQRFRCLGQTKTNGTIPNSLLKSDDGFLYTNLREPVQCLPGENYCLYSMPHSIPNGDYTLLIHSTVSNLSLEVNGKSVDQQIQDAFSKQTSVTDIANFTSYVAKIPVKIKDGTLNLKSYHRDTSFRKMHKLCAFALLDDKVYKEKELSDDERRERALEKQTLADKLEPLQTSVTRKDMTIVGWSPNLLLNSSAELGNLKHWNITGDMKIEDGGYGTEKCLKTSHMWTEKYQEVNLLDHFTAEYLDTAPDIHVMEMYREGHCEGGFYKIKAELMNENGQVLSSYDPGQTANLYKGKVWQEASHTFTSYGPGVRIVAFSSAGKDDKFWAGHFGPIMSAASVRVKRETKTAEGDEFCDLKMLDDDRKVAIENLVTKVLSDNQELLQDFVTEDKMPVDETFERQTALETTPQTLKKKRKRKKREIRVFVSSTFRDFASEREEIIKKAFREINKICSDRGVFFTYVDLRWGITSEQTDDGKTIAICLQEIDRCRPYFICLMGERFGWSQQEDKKDEVLNTTYNYAIETQQNLKWIEDYRYNSSVTQLEVFHGVLNDVGTVKDKSFFYLRDPVKPEDFPESEYKRMKAESDWHAERQIWLRNEVLKHKDSLTVKNFQNASQVSDMIKQDLERCVNEDFPIGDNLTKLELQREAHIAFAEARCRVYIGREEYFTQINEARQKEINEPFVLLGESGSGKSALVANWVKRVEDKEPDTFMFVHFIGSSADSAHYIKLIRRLYEEMKTYFAFDMQVPSSESQLINELGKWLRMAGTRARTVVVFDALNQMDDGMGTGEGTEHDLQWIPAELPPNVFLLVSTLPGRSMDACKTCGWPSMKVEPLDDSQKQQIITDYLGGVYGKTLTQDQQDMIIRSEQTSNALYLKSLLDEVRMYGHFRTLTTKIQDYLTATSPGDLFAKILERLEDDFDKGSTSRAGMVRDATTAIWCSNRGMSETELMELLDVKSAIWSPFYLSLYENLVNRDGIVNFFHDHLRQAVEKKYLSTQAEKTACYLKLANFFSAMDTNARTVDELPFLFTKAGELERLRATISDLDVFYRLSANMDGMFELVKAWRTLGNFSLAEEAYFEKLAEIPQQVIYDNSDYYCQLYSQMGGFFKTIGLVEAAKTIYETLIPHLEHNYGESNGTVVYSPHNQSWTYRCKHPTVINALQELAAVNESLGDLDKAVQIYTDAINRQTRVETPTQKLQVCQGLLGMAAVLVRKEDMSSAKKLLSRALELAVEVLGKRHKFVAAIFTRLGQLSYRQGRIDETLAYCMQDLKVTRSEVGTSHPRMAVVLNDIALVYDDRNDTLAGELYEAALMILLQTYGKNFIGTGMIRYNLGAFYFGTNYFSKARYQFQEAYRVLKMFLGEDHTDTKAAKAAMDTASTFG